VEDTPFFITFSNLHRRFYTTSKDVDILIDYLEVEGIRIMPYVINELLVDKDDIPFLEVAISGEANALITGNKRHFKTRRARRLKIMNPEEFLEMWSKMKSSDRKR